MPVIDTIFHGSEQRISVTTLLLPLAWALLCNWLLVMLMEAYCDMIVQCGACHSVFLLLMFTQATTGTTTPMAAQARQVWCTGSGGRSRLTVRMVTRAVLLSRTVLSVVRANTVSTKATPSISLPRRGKSSEGLRSSAGQQAIMRSLSYSPAWSLPGPHCG